METEIRYSKMLRELLDDHSNVVTLLAEGFKEAKKHIKVNQLLPDCSSYIVYFVWLFHWCFHCEFCYVLCNEYLSEDSLSVFICGFVLTFSSTQKDHLTLIAKKMLIYNIEICQADQSMAL